MSLLDKFTPYVAWIKLAAVLALLGGVAFGGYRYGSATQADEDQKSLNKVQAELVAERAAHDADKLTWSNTVASMNADAAKKLAAAQEAADKQAQIQQKKLDDANVKFNQAQKALTDEHQKALDLVVHPFSSADPVTDGMWVDTDSATCYTAGDSDNHHSLSQAALGAASASVLRCRLSPSTASRLIESAADANRVVANLNLCWSTLKAASEVEVPKESVSTDDQKASQVEDKADGGQE